MQKEPRIACGTIIRKNLMIVPLFLILEYTKSTHPSKLKVTKLNQKKRAFMFKKCTIK